MESNNLGASVQSQPGPTKKRGRRTYLVIAAILMAIILIAIAIEIPTLSNHSHQILRSGDLLEYKVIGYANNTSFTTSTNITINGASEAGIGYESSGFQWFNVSVPNFISNKFISYLSDPGYYGRLVCNQQINTRLGVKTVMLLSDLDVYHREMNIIDVGLDSYIVYRWTIASLDGTYHYQYELTNTNNTAVANADTVMHSSNVKGLGKPQDTIGQTYSFWAGPPVSMGGSECSGTVEFCQGQKFHYIVGGNATGAYVLNVGDFQRSDLAGQFLYNESLSRLPGNPGEVNDTVSPGTYWFLIFYHGSDTNVTFDGEEVGGYFVPYWG